MDFKTKIQDTDMLKTLELFFDEFTNNSKLNSEKIAIFKR